MSVSRLCIIGNSHLACIKLAHAEQADTAIDFFAASANRISHLGISDGRYLRTGNAKVEKQMRAVSSGRERIDIRDYDAFGFVGISFEFRDFVRLFRTHCLYRHATWQAGRALISDEGFKDFQKSLYTYRPAYRLAREITAIRPDAPLLIVAAPFPVEAVLTAKPVHPLRALRGTPYFQEIATLYQACAAAAARSVGARISFQRTETFAAPGFTAQRYNSNSQVVRLDPLAPPKSRTDPWHMNVDFGRLRLADIGESVGLPLRPPVVLPG